MTMICFEDGQLKAKALINYRSSYEDKFWSEDEALKDKANGQRSEEHLISFVTLS